MKFSEALAQTSRESGQRFKLDVYLESMDAKDASDVRAALMDTALPDSHLSRALGAMGYPLSSSSVRNWRQRYVS